MRNRPEMGSNHQTDPRREEVSLILLGVTEVGKKTAEKLGKEHWNKKKRTFQKKIHNRTWNFPDWVKRASIKLKNPKNGRQRSTAKKGCSEYKGKGHDVSETGTELVIRLKMAWGGEKEPEGVG